jgi:hypothetical protein
MRLLDYLAVTTTLKELRLEGDCLFDYHDPQLVNAISLSMSLGRVKSYVETVRPD